MEPAVAAAMQADDAAFNATNIAGSAANTQESVHSAVRPEPNHGRVSIARK